MNRESAAADEALMRMIACGELRPLVRRVPWDAYAAAIGAIAARCSRRDGENRLSGEATLSI